LLFAPFLSSVSDWPSPRSRVHVAVVQPAWSLTWRVLWSDGREHHAGWSRRAEFLLARRSRTSSRRCTSWARHESIYPTREPIRRFMGGEEGG